MAYIIRKIQGKTGITYKAIIHDKHGTHLKSKNFTRRGDAEAWAKPIDADREKMETLGLRGASMTFADLVDEYAQQWNKRDQNQVYRLAYWSKIPPGILARFRFALHHLHFTPNTRRHGISPGTRQVIQSLPIDFIEVVDQAHEFIAVDQQQAGFFPFANSWAPWMNSEVVKKMPCRTLSAAMMPYSSRMDQAIADRSAPGFALGNGKDLAAAIAYFDIDAAIRSGTGHVSHAIHDPQILHRDFFEPLPFERLHIRACPI